MSDEPDLIHAYLDGTASDQDAQRLNDWINEDVANARRFAEIALLHDQLHNHYVSQDLLVNAGENADTSSPEFRSDSNPNRLARLKLANLVIAASAVVLLLAFGLMWRQENHGDTENAATVRLGQVSGQIKVTAADGTKRDPPTAVTIEVDSIVETTGPTSFAELEFSDGTKLLIAGESRVVCNSVHPKRVTVLKGSISASVFPQPDGAPMIVKTPVAEVEVLGREFHLAATAAVTDLQVNEGRVRFTQSNGGESLVVDQGERAVARVSNSKVAVSSVQHQKDAWAEDYEDGLPVSCVHGVFSSVDLPKGSRGAVSNVLVNDQQETYAIDHNDWINGLFRVHNDSHLHIIYRMRNPGWMNVFFLTRDDNPKTSNVTLHLFNKAPNPSNDQWYKAVIPLSKFHRKVNGRFTDLPPKDDQLCFGLLFSWVDGPRGMTIDRAWISRGGPGKIVVKPLNELSKVEK